MKNLVLVRGARQLLTLRGPSGPRRGSALRDLSIIPDGAVLISGGIVADVGPSRRVENLAAARLATEIDATGRVVMPGFIDSHTHLICSPPRLGDYEMRLAGATDAEVEAAGGGLDAILRTVRAATARGLEQRAQHILPMMARHGTTTVEAKSGFALDEAGEMKLLRVVRELGGGPLDLVPTFFGAHVVPREFDGRAGEYIGWLCEHLMPKIRKRGLAQFADLAYSRGVFDGGEATKYLAAARQLGWPVRFHVAAESRLEAVRVAVEAGAASVDYLPGAGEPEGVLLAASHTIATLLPASVFHSGAVAYPQARTLIDCGVAVALGSDFCHLSPTFSMPMVISLACTAMRMTPAEAISAATINGAHALHRGGRTGSIEYLKDADLIMLDFADYREMAYAAGVNPVSLTIKRGQVVYRHGQPVRLAPPDAPGQAARGPW